MRWLCNSFHCTNWKHSYGTLTGSHFALAFDAVNDLDNYIICLFVQTAADVHFECVRLYYCFRYGEQQNLGDSLYNMGEGVTEKKKFFKN